LEPAINGGFGWDWIPRACEKKLPDLAKLKKCDSETKKHLARQHNFGNFAQDVGPYVEGGQGPKSN